MSQAADTVRAVRDVLGMDLAAAYLFGSAVQDGLYPHSDVDVLAVSRRRTTVNERHALVDGLMRISGTYPRRGPARPVELTLVVQGDIRPWRYPPRCEFQYGEWLRDEYERGATPTPAASSDLAVLITMVRQSGTPLLGRRPEEVLDPVPWKDLARSLVDGVPDLLSELETDTRNAVLTLARIWMSLATGTLNAKHVAADWALHRLPVEYQPVLARARAIHLGEHEEAWQDLLPSIRPYANHVVSAITRQAGRDSQTNPH